MNKKIVDAVQDLNRLTDRLNIENKPRILRFKEVFNYIEHNGTFDSYITVTIRSLDGFIKTYNFPTERAFENAVVDLTTYGYANLKRIKKYTK